VHDRERITQENWCDLAVRWGVATEVMRRIATAAAQYFMQTGGLPVHIVSGFRTRAEQEKLKRQGRPTAPDDQSTHRSCPATGVDISLGFAPTNFQKVIWGGLAIDNALRWGGGSPVDEDGVIPVDWQHVDIGPRN